MRDKYNIKVHLVLIYSDPIIVKEKEKYTGIIMIQIKEGDCTM